MKKIKKIMAYALILTMVIASVGISKTEVAEASTGPLNIAIYGDTGADTMSISALCMAFERMGHDPMVIAAGDLVNNRLTTSNFDVLVIPASDTDADELSGYDDTIGGREDKIRSFVNAGGGVVAIEYGAAFMCDKLNVTYGFSDYKDTKLYSGEAYIGLPDVGHGMSVISTSTAFNGGNERVVYMSENTPYFTQETGANVFATYKTGGISNFKAAIIGFQYNNGGYVTLVGPRLELDVTSEDDLSWWDNKRASSYDPDSDLDLLARCLEYSVTGTQFDYGTTISSVSTSGMRVGIYSDHSYVYGGAWPAYLPAVFKSVLEAGHTPVAIGRNDLNTLVTDFYDVIIFPGGYSSGYWSMNYENQDNISQYVYDGGSVMGICAGAYYLSDIVDWEGSSYDYPIDVFTGTAHGPINDIATWPSRDFVTVDVSDTTLGLNDDYTITYYGGPYFTGGTKTIVGEYDYGGQADGQPAIIRGTYGSGRFVLSGPHPETEEGYTNDWCFWDNYEYNSTTAQTDPESDWIIIEEALDWLAGYSYGGSTPTMSNIQLPIQKGIYDNTADTIGDAQKIYDYTGLGISRDNGVYEVGHGKYMELTGFGKTAPSTLNSVMLYVKYICDYPTAHNYVQWSVDGTNYYNTTIHPEEDEDWLASFDLKAAGVDTLNELRNLRIRYYGSCQFGSVDFDSVVVVAE